MRSNEAVYAACLYMARNACLERSKRFVWYVLKRDWSCVQAEMVVERVTPDDLVNRFFSKLGLTRQCRREVAELTVKNAETTVLGCSSGDLLDLGQISERNQGGVSEVTIRHAVKLLCNRKGV